MDSKKSYSAPTITVHGNAVEETRGLVGAAFESYGSKHDTFEWDW